MKTKMDPQQLLELNNDVFGKNTTEAESTFIEVHILIDTLYY